MGPTASSSVSKVFLNRTATFSLLCVLLLLALSSMLAGAGYQDAATSLAFMLGDESIRGDSQVSMVMLELRFPRMVVAILVGAVLGLAGCLLQTVTRNGLAEPGLLGVNAGAALGVVIGITYANAETGASYLIWAFAGALITNLLIVSAAQLRSSVVTPLKLILAGIAIQASFQGMIGLILMQNPLSLDQYRYWVLGSLSGVSLQLATDVVPALIVALILVIAIARPLSALMLGDDVAKSLGHRPGLTRVLVAFTVTLCAGSAVALTGPISFLGLMAPHFARSIAGPRLLPLMFFSALIGSILLLLADILARLIAQPYETPVSVVIAVLGAPVLIWIVRQGKVLTRTAS